MGKNLANFFHGCFVIVMFDFIFLSIRVYVLCMFEFTTMGLPNTTHQVPPRYSATHS